MGRIKRYWNRKGPPPLDWKDEQEALYRKIAQLEARIKTRDQELVKEYRRRQRQQERVNKVQRLLHEIPSTDALQRLAVEKFSEIYADLMRQATDNRTLEALMQIGPHTISDARIGGMIDEEKQPPSLWLTLPELEIRVRVDERIWPAGRMTPEEAERLLGRPAAGLVLIKGGKA